MWAVWFAGAATPDFSGTREECDAYVARFRAQGFDRYVGMLSVAEFLADNEVA